MSTKVVSGVIPAVHEHPNIYVSEQSRPVSVIH